MAGPPTGQNLDDAVMVGSDEDDFLGAAELLSQQAEEVQPTRGLLGLEGPVTSLKIELENYLNLPKLPTCQCSALVEGSPTYATPPRPSCQKISLCHCFISTI